MPEESPAHHVSGWDGDGFPQFRTLSLWRLPQSVTSLTHHANDSMNMSLEIPTGLRFTEVGGHCARECLPLAVRLAEACIRRRGTCGLDGGNLISK